MGSINRFRLACPRIAKRDFGIRMLGVEHLAERQRTLEERLRPFRADAPAAVQGKCNVLGRSPIVPGM